MKKKFSPSFRNLISPSVATVGRSRGRPIIREIIHYLGEMRGEVITCDFLGLAGRFEAKSARCTGNAPKKH